MKINSILKKTDTEKSQVDQRKWDKKKKTILFITATVTAILILIITITVLFFTSVPYSIYRNMKKQDYSSVVKEYRVEVEDNFINEFILNALLSHEIDRAANNYYSGEWDYDSATKHLEVLEKIHFVNAEKKLDEITEYHANGIVEGFNNNEYSYDEAKKEISDLEKSGYNNAKDKVNKINESYANKIVAGFTDNEIDYLDAFQTLNNLQATGYKNAKSKIETLFEICANNTVSKYENGKIGYNDAINTLRILHADGYIKADEAISKITAIENSNIALNKGNEHYVNGNYEQAMSELSKIPESSKNYGEAQNILKQVYTDYIEHIVETVTAYNTNKQYKDALIYVNVAYGILPDHLDTSKIDVLKQESITSYKTEIGTRVNTLIGTSKYIEAFSVIEDAIAFDNNEYFKTLKASTQEKYITYILKSVTDYESASDYISAIRTIENAHMIVKQNPDFIQKLNELKSSYKNQLISKADAALKSTGYQSAIELIQDGLNVLPNDSEFLAKIEEYKEYRPVDLGDFQVTAKNGYYFSSSESDPRGEVNTDVLYLEGFVEFYIGGKYCNFSAKIDPERYFSTSPYAGIQLTILADGEMVYRSQTITYKTDDLEISVNINNANYISFQLVYVGGTKYSDNWSSSDDIMIYDAVVSK